MTGALLLTLAHAATAGSSSVTLEVVAPSAHAGLEIRAETTWLGEARTARLVDDGSVEGDVPGDGVWTARWTGDAVRGLPLVLTVDEQGRSTQVYAGNEIVTAEHDRLAFILNLGPPPTATRTSRPLAPPEQARLEASRVIGPIAWGVLLLNYVGWLAWRLRRRETA